MAAACSSVCRRLAYSSISRMFVKKPIPSPVTTCSIRALASVSRQPVALLSTTPAPKTKTISITFTDRDGDVRTVKGKIGDSLMEVAKEYDIDLEVDKDWYDKIPDLLTEEEEDMLDLAYGLTDTSRLGCQILVSEALDGIKVTVPSMTRDARNT